MRKKILLSLLIFNIILPSFSQGTIVSSSPYTNYGRSYRHYNRIPVSHPYRLNNLERYTFGRTYPYETDAHRLHRLERQAFGEEQYGNFEERYSNAKYAILNRPKQNHNKTLLRRFTNFMDGEMTGFTPQITPRVTIIE